jgi:catechol 2,3-dioxygenase
MKNGDLQMATNPLDFEGVMAELGNAQATWAGLHPETTMGHIHLHVNYLEANELFYTEVLGFDLINRYGPAAAFVSAGGYHHHIGLNTWAGVGAPVAAEGDIGLNWFTILLPDAAALAETAVHLQTSNTPFQEKNGGLFLRDPAHNGIKLKVAT